MSVANVAEIRAEYERLMSRGIWTTTDLLRMLRYVPALLDVAERNERMRQSDDDAQGCLRSGGGCCYAS